MDISYVHSGVDSQHSYHRQSYAKVDINPMPVSNLSPVRDFGFGLRPAEVDRHTDTFLCLFESVAPVGPITEYMFLLQMKQG